MGGSFTDMGGSFTDMGGSFTDSVFISVTNVRIGNCVEIIQVIVSVDVKI